MTQKSVVSGRPGCLASLYFLRRQIRTDRQEEEGAYNKGDEEAAQGCNLRNTFLQLLLGVHGLVTHVTLRWCPQAVCQSTGKLERLLCILRDDPSVSSVGVTL